MADILSVISLVSFILSGVALVLSILLFILLRIPAVIGDLSGQTAKKSIARMRVSNEKSGSKSYRTNKTNAERGKVTATIKGIESNQNTEKPETGLLSDNKATELKAQATALLEKETTGLLTDCDVTAPLNETPQKLKLGGKTLNVIEDIIIIHTDEVIG